MFKGQTLKGISMVEGHTERRNEQRNYKLTHVLEFLVFKICPKPPSLWNRSTRKTVTYYPLFNSFCLEGFIKPMSIFFPSILECLTLC